MNKYDYTAKRLGSKQPPYNHKIIVCAKCGKRGTDDGTHIVNGHTTQNVTHRSHISAIAVFAVCHIDEWCSYFVEAPPTNTTPAEAKEKTR